MTEGETTGMQRQEIAASTMPHLARSPCEGGMRTPTREDIRSQYVIPMPNKVSQAVNEDSPAPRPKASSVRLRSTTFRSALRRQVRARSSKTASPKTKVLFVFPASPSRAASQFLPAPPASTLKVAEPSPCRGHARGGTGGWGHWKCVGQV